MATERKAVICITAAIQTSPDASYSEVSMILKENGWIIGHFRASNAPVKIKYGFCNGMGKLVIYGYKKTHRPE